MDFKACLKENHMLISTFLSQWCQAHDPGSACGLGWLQVWPNTKSQIYLKPCCCSSVFVSVYVFNVWPKTILLLPI